MHPDHITPPPCVYTAPERWLPVPDWPEYDASDWGRVRTYWKPRHSEILSTPSRMQGTIRDGYLVVTMIRRPNKGKKERRNGRVNRLVLEAFVGPCPEGMESCHGDGNRLNNHLSNLRWDTRSSNTIDSVLHGTHSTVKLAEVDVVAIWSRLANGDKPPKIAKDYNLTRQVIYDIRRGRSWSHVTSRL